MSTTGSVASAGLSPEQYEAQYYRNQLQEVEAQIAALHKNVFTNCDEELRVLYARRTDILNVAVRRGACARPEETVGGDFPDDESDSESEGAPAGGGFADGTRVVNDEFWTKLGYNLDPQFRRL